MMAEKIRRRIFFFFSNEKINEDILSSRKK
jgi:hypothetical protein